MSTSPPAPQPLTTPGATDEVADARIARGALALASAQPILWAAGLATTILLPRFLGDEALGQYALALAIATLPSMISSLGIPRYLPARVAAFPHRASVEGPAAVILITGAAFVLGIATFLVCLSVGLLSGAPHVLVLALLGMILWKPSHIVQSVLTGRERFKSLAALSAAATAVVATAGLAVLALGGNLVGYMGINALVGAGVGLFAWRLCGFQLKSEIWDRALLVQLIRRGLPYLGWNIVRRGYGEGDRVLLGLLSTQVAIGWYAAAGRVAFAPLVFSSFITAPLLPALARHVSDQAVFQRIFRRALLGSMVLTVPCSALIVGLAPLLPSVLGWPESFAQSVPLMMILALHTPLVAMDMVFGTALLALDRERLWLRVGMIALVFNLGLNLVLIPFFQQATQNGAIAAAILTSLTELLLLIGALVLLPRGLFDRETATTAVRIMLAGVAMGLVCALLQTNSPAFAVLASTIAFAGTAAALGVFRSADIRALCSFLAAKLSISFGRRTSAREVDLVNL